MFLLVTSKECCKIPSGLKEGISFQIWHIYIDIATVGLSGFKTHLEKPPLPSLPPSLLTPIITAGRDATATAALPVALIQGPKQHGSDGSLSLGGSKWWAGLTPHQLFQAGGVSGKFVEHLCDLSEPHLELKSQGVSLLSPCSPLPKLHHHPQSLTGAKILDTPQHISWFCLPTSLEPFRYNCYTGPFICLTKCACIEKFIA